MAGGGLLAPITCWPQHPRPMAEVHPYERAGASKSKQTHCGPVHEQCMCLQGLEMDGL